jgi:cation transport ATPase
MTMNEGGQEWKPQAEGLQQIIQLLKESQSIDNTIQKNVQKVTFFFNIIIVIIHSI